MMDWILEAVQMDWWLFWIIVVVALGIIVWAWRIEVTNDRKAADLRRRKMGCPK